MKPNPTPTNLQREKKIILDLCGGTGAWSRPYAEAGYDVRVITLPEHDILTYEPPDNVYGILAAPPCTMFSMVRTTAKKPRDFNEGMAPVKACLEVIWKCRIAGTLKFWALENPRGYLRHFLGRPWYEFDPTEFGDKHNKRTCLWGWFNEPKKTREYKKTFSHAISNEGFEELPADYVPDPNMRWDAIRRSITPAGFAKAFMEANL